MFRKGARPAARNSAAAVAKELRQHGTPARARASAWFFKTGKGEYGHGDRFCGVSVPDQRRIAKLHAGLPLPEVATLLASKTHERRLTALFILVRQYERGDEKTRQRIARFYLANRSRVNNWDLVDSSAPQILGRHLVTRDRRVLYRLARSRNVWDRRMAMLATFAFIREQDYEDALRIAELLLEDSHDLIHKAVGWLLREIGNRSLADEERFLRKHASAMPRTMLRYAIENFPPNKRAAYLTDQTTPRGHAGRLGRSCLLADGVALTPRRPRAAP